MLDSARSSVCHRSRPRGLAPGPPHSAGNGHAGSHEGRPLAGHRRRLRRPSPRRPAARGAFPGAALVGEEQADTLRLAEGVAILDQITRFVRTAIPDATPDEVCNLIDRGSGEAPTRFGRSIRSTAPKASCGASSTRSPWHSYATATWSSASSAARNSPTARATNSAAPAHSSRLWQGKALGRNHCRRIAHRDA